MTTMLAWLLPLLLLGATFGPTADGPTPAIVWPAGPMEVRAAFSKPIPAPILAGQAIAFRTSLGFDGHLTIAASRLVDDGRTLVLYTDPHSAPATFKPPGMPSYNLSGVEASWSEGDGDGPDDEPRIKTWLPGLDLEAARKITANSVEHDRLFASLSKPGRLTIKAQLAMKPGRRTIQLRSNVPMEVALGADQEQGREVSREFEATDFPEDLTVIVPTGAKALTLKATEAGQPLPTEALRLPWAPAPPASASSPFEPPYPLDGGDAARGETIFFAESSKCSVCHKVGGKGGDVGPSLDRPRQRDLAWLFRAIAAPGDEVRPDYVAHAIATEDGQVVVGVVRAEGADALRVFDTDGKSTVVPRSAVSTFQPSSTSIMPVGLAGAIGEAGIRDLLAFLAADRPAQ